MGTDNILYTQLGFEKKLREQFLKQQKERVELGKKAMEIMVTRGIVTSIVSLSLAKVDEKFEVSFFGRLEWETSRRIIKESFIELTRAKDLALAILAHSNFEERSLLEINNWNGKYAINFKGSKVT